MNGDGSLGYWYHKTINFPSCSCKEDDEIFEEEGIEMYSGMEIL